MASPIDVRPGQRFTDWRDGVKIRLLPTTGGVMHKPLIVPGGTDDIEITTAEGPDNTIIDGENREEFCIRLNDGCMRPRILNVGMVGAGHGIRITHSQDYYVEGCKGKNMAVETCHIAHSRGKVKNLYCEHNGYWRFQDYPPDKAHGLYIAGLSTGSEVDGLIVKDCKGSAFQHNSASTREKSFDLIIKNLEAIRVGMGGGGTYAISLMGANRFQFYNLYVENATGFVMFHADGKGSAYACYDNDFVNYKVVGDSRIGNNDGSARNTFDPGTGYDPSWKEEGGEVPPPDGGGTDEELQAEIERLEQELASMTADRDKYKGMVTSARPHADAVCAALKEN